MDVTIYEDLPIPETICSYPGCTSRAVAFRPTRRRSWLERVADIPGKDPEGTCQVHRFFLHIRQEDYLRVSSTQRAILEIQATEDMAFIDAVNDAIALERAINLPPY